MSLLRQVEQRVDQALRKLFSGPGEGRELLEVQQAWLDDIAAHVQKGRRGALLFPYNHLLCEITVPDDTRRALYEASLLGNDAMLQDVRGVLEQAGCPVPADLQVEVQLTDHPLPRGFQVLYQQRKERAVERLASVAASSLSVVKGQAEPITLPLGKSRVNVGRLSEVLDDQERVVRRNDLAFAEGDPVGATVSRTHGHVLLDEATHEYRLFDDGSAYGTAVFRGGRQIPVPAGPGRGVALQPGDEIYFGQARVRFEQP